jgi:hypothetical protein
MIGAIAGIIRYRWGASLTVFLLAVLAIAAAGAAPGYVAVAAQVVTDQEVAAAAAHERVISGNSLVQVAANPDEPNSENDLAASRAAAFDRNAAGVLSATGQKPIFSTSFDSWYEPVGHIPAAPHLVGRTMYRDDVCQHVRILAGRCLSGPIEVLIPARLASALSLKVGDRVNASLAIQVEQEQVRVWIPGGPTTGLTVVGTYEPIDAADLYWGIDRLFGTVGEEYAEAPTFASRATIGAIVHYEERQEVEAALPASAFAPDHLGATEAMVAQLRATKQPSWSPRLGVQDLIDRIHRDQDELPGAPTIAAIPLVALCCLVIYLAVAAGAQIRRSEHGLAKMRGMRTLDRWWLGLGDSVTAVVVAVPAGFVVGKLMVWGFSAATMDGATGAAVFAPSTWAVGIRATLIAGAVASAATVLGARPALTTPAAELMRRVPPRRTALPGAVAPIVLVVLTAASLVVLRSSHGVAHGWLELAAPGVFMVAVAGLGAPLVDRLAGAWGRRAMHRGRLAASLAALDLSRRQGAHRVVATLSVTLALLGFAAAAVNVSRATTARLNDISFGADRVLGVENIAPIDLMERIERIDPGGRFAMVAYPQASADGLPVLAVDSRRLGAVAHWPAWLGKIGAPAAAQRLRPASFRPVFVHGDGVDIDLTITSASSIDTLSIDFSFGRVDGAGGDHPQLRGLRLGRATYHVNALCQFTPCWLRNMQVYDSAGAVMTVDMTVHEVRQTGPSVVLSRAEDIASTWRPAGALAANPPIAVTADPAGGHVRSLLPTSSITTIAIGSGPFQVPVLTAGGGSTPAQFTGPDALSHPIASAGKVLALPGLGTKGMLTDLAVAADAGPGVPRFAYGQIWLNGKAPPDILDQLAKARIPVVTDKRLADVHAGESSQPGAISVRFFVAAALFALVLGAGTLLMVAALERPGRAAELRNLIVQGVDRRTIRAAARQGYLIVTLAAAVLGIAAAAAAWAATNQRLPTLAGVTAGVSPSPASVELAVVVVGAFAVLVLVALGAGRALSRAAGKVDAQGREAP